MIIKIDTTLNEVIFENNSEKNRFALNSAEAFSLISQAWLRCGWDNKYVYSFSWLGRPIIQLPEDIIRIQEVIYAIQPDIIIETGIAHGGSLIFYASLCKLIGKGKVIGVDIEIRPHNKIAIEEHALKAFITLVEGGSIDKTVFDQVKSFIKKGDSVLVILDSNHTKDHVLKELKAYSELVSVGSYIVATDGIMGDLIGAPRSREDWSWNNPKAAAEEFVKDNNKFVIEEPSFPFNEGNITDRVTYWPKAFLRRIM